MSAAFPFGRMRHRLTLEAPVDTGDDTGGVNRTYVWAGALWASITPVTMAHRFIASRDEQVVTHQIAFRHRTGLNAAMRFRAGERVFHILAIEDADAARNYMRALCEEIGK